MKKPSSAVLHSDKTGSRGFTLVEILLFIGIAATTLAGIAALLSVVLSARAKSQSISEVDSQATAAMQIMTQAIRNADGANSP